MVAKTGLPDRKQAANQKESPVPLHGRSNLRLRARSGGRSSASRLNKDRFRNRSVPLVRNPNVHR